MMSNINNESEKDRIYRAYRLALKGSKEHRAGERKQRAREIITTRYNISHHELKDIICTLDKENNITHEHTLDYERELTLKKLNEDLRDEDRICTSCGSEEETVRYRYNPYEINVNREYVIYKSCLECDVRLEYDI